MMFKYILFDDFESMLLQKLFLILLNLETLKKIQILSSTFAFLSEKSFSLCPYNQSLWLIQHKGKQS